MLKEERGYVRSIDVAEKLGVTKPSVSYATKRLRESGYIAFDPAGMIVLLEPGLEIAERIYERHKLLTQMLIGLGVSEETAREDACKIAGTRSNTADNQKRKWTSDPCSAGSEVHSFMLLFFPCQKPAAKPPFLPFAAYRMAARST